MTFGSLFAGIGGFDLGFERAGLVCKWQVEIDPFCRAVLAKHWPSVRRHDDVKTWPQPDTESVDVICGGFPCQDISIAGKGAGINGERSKLWFEFARIIRELRPKVVVVENSSALLGRGMGSVLGDLADSGYDAEWHCIQAKAFGLPHERQRLFVIAYSDRFVGAKRLRVYQHSQEARISPGNGVERFAVDERTLAAAPRFSRVDDGVPRRMDRVRALGNAVVPQITEWIGRQLCDAQ